MVKFANAIIDPRTMVVHFSNASFAHATMMSPRGTISLASPANCPVFALKRKKLNRKFSSELSY